MEPRIQYAKTSDGVNIAYAEAGEGPPFIMMSAPGFAHVELSWQVYPNLPTVAAKNRLIWYDPRGTGLSDRDAIDFSIRAMVLDLEAVVAHVGLHSFVLGAWVNAVPTAVTYAVANPKRVTHLILVDGFTRFADIAQGPAYKAAAALLEMDWLLFTETLGQVIWAHANPEYGRGISAFARACSEPDAHRALWEAWKSYDVASRLPEITIPTLVVHNRNNRLIPPVVGQRIAAAIPGARLAMIDDITYGGVGEMVEGFVNEGEAPAERGSKLPSGMTAILFADIADSTDLTERLGDAAFRAKARDLDAFSMMSWHSSIRRALRSNAPSRSR